MPLSLPHRNYAKLAKFWNLWTFWLIIQLISHLSKIQKKAFLPNTYRPKCPRGCRFLLFCHHSYEVTLGNRCARLLTCKYRWTLLKALSIRGNWHEWWHTFTYIFIIFNFNDRLNGEWYVFSFLNIASKYKWFRLEALKIRGK